MAEALEILWSPIRFMRARCREEIQLAMPFAIFIGALLLSVIDMAIMYGRLMGKLPASVQDSMTLANLGFGLNLFAFSINMFLFWVVGTGILACLAIMLDGEGEYRRALQLSGLAHLPVLIFSLMGLVIALGYHPQANFERLFINRDLKEMSKPQQREFDQNLRKEVYKETRSTRFKVIKALQHSFYIWTMVLCVLAVHFAFNLNYVKSTVSVGGLLLLYIILEVARERLMKG